MRQILHVAVALLFAPGAGAFGAFSASRAARGSRVAHRMCAPPAVGNADAPALAIPPNSFEVLLKQAQASTIAAAADGHRLVEVEFPPLPTAQLEDAGSSAYEVSDANVRLAVRFAQGLGMRAAVIVPDRPELERAMRVCAGRQRPYANVSLHALTSGATVLSSSDNSVNAQSANWIDGFFSLINIDRWGKGDLVDVPEAELYVVITASCQELPDVERLWRDVGPKGKQLVLFNLKLDTQRGDLGLPAFPSKSLQHRFLSYVRPVYFLRSRSYSLSLRRPPFLLPFSGALFRTYPGPYQCLLDTGNGRYRLVQTDERRPALGEFKESLRQALKVDESDKGKASDVLTRGYKTKTWFEEDSGKQDESNDWRS